MDINHVVIAGAGIMGSSIAQIFGANHYRVSLYDLNDKILEKSKELITLHRGRVEKKDHGNITFHSDTECFRDADLVIEAIVEKMEVKHSFFREISRIVPDTAILTSNTSGLSLTQIAQAIKNPERFCGMHWLNPPHICPLVEIIRAKDTDTEITKRVFDIAVRIGKHPVLLNREVPGFFINRFQFAILREALSLVESGAAQMKDIDDVFKYGLGMRYACLGPFEIADLGGLDTFEKIASYLFKDLSCEKEVPKLLAEVVGEGKYGVKTGEGFYDYTNGRDQTVIEKRDQDLLKISKCLYDT